MFMQTTSCDSNENVYCLSHANICGEKPRYYKSNFHDKVKWDIWLARSGCCRTIGPPPKICRDGPEDFLKKHSMRAPVYFTESQLRLKPTQAAFDYKGHRPASPEVKPVKQPHCTYPKPPSQMGLFRGAHEDTYEQKYRIGIKKQKPFPPCICSKMMLQDLVEATKCDGAYPDEMDSSKKPLEKDHIRSNALKAIRMPARKQRRCYVDKCGVHLLDMTEGPFVLRPGFGKIPDYLKKRKAEMLNEDLCYKKCVEDQVKKDLQQVADEERETVIEGLKDYWTELLNQYNTLPVHGSDRSREARAELEARMKEVERDLRLLTTCCALFVGDVENSHYL